MIRLLLIMILLIGVSMTISSCKQNVETKNQTTTEKATQTVVNKVIVEMKTNLGMFKIELYPDKAPITVENFLKYVNDKFYDGLVFHRIISTFMVQGGGFDTEGNQKKAAYEPIKNEANNGLSNSRGTIAMARTNIVDSATSQFFINVVDNTFLDHKSTNPAEFGYCVFGKVIEGMDVVDQIKVVKTGKKSNGMTDWPVDSVVIEYAKVIK